MNVIIPIPDDFAARFGSAAELGRRALEALALAEYRAGRMTLSELQRVLGLSDGSAFDGFLRAHGVAEPTSPLERRLAGIRTRLRSASEDERKAAASELVERFKAFRAGKTLGGLKIKDLIAEGRR
jgi:hypothetical protein